MATSGVLAADGPTGARGEPRSDTRTAARSWLGNRRLPALLFLFAGLTIGDALLRNRGSADYRLIELVRLLEPPGFHRISSAFVDATSVGALALAWVLVIGIAALRRDWLGMVLVAAMAVVDPLTSLLQEAVQRPHPDVNMIEGLEGASQIAGSGAFPSADVVGTTLVVGAAVMILTSRSGPRVRAAVQTAGFALIALAGLARIWIGMDWVGDVVAAYAIAGGLLLVMAQGYRTAAPALQGLPLVRAGSIPHGDGPHAHALTSTILFRDGTATKIYNPGFVPRAIYWIAYQAPFAYASNPLALRAAVFRRNLAGLLTEYWYGERRVATALGVTDEGGHPAIVGQFIEGTEPRNVDAARRFLFDLANRFDASGLPTWQIDPRQPRALGNLVETADGRFVVIDLESGLVSPLASPRTWRRALRRGLVPIFDDVFFDITRAYVAEEATQMRAAKGEAWFRELETVLTAAEETAAAWHSSEARIWSRLLCGMWNGFGLPGLPRKLRRATESAETRAVAWLEESVVTWEREGRIDAAEAARLRQSTLDPEFQAVLPHLGVHLVIGVALRFPLGSIARFTYSSGQLAAATFRALTRRTDKAAWQKARRVHSPLVLLVSAMPGVGTFAYLVSPAIRRNGHLTRVGLDSAATHLPWRLYERSGLRRIVAGRLRGPGPTPASRA